jgi:hypothetical protein
LKRYVFALAAVLSFAFGAAGTVLAQPTKGPHQKASHTTRRPSLVPSIALAPHPRRWLQPLRTVRQGHTAKSAHRHPTKVRHRHAAKKRQPQPRQHLRATTLSIYEHTTKPWVLRVQGCSAALRHENGIVILDFGKPAFARHGYGTILFSGRFALNHQITAGMVGYARGYVSCLPRGSRAHIVLARGTSNYHPSVPSAYTAGVRWGRATNKLGRIFHGKGLARHVEAAAADDAEPAWDRRFRKTGQFFHGFRTAVHGHTLYDYGSLDGGIGAVWTARQAWYVAGGLRHTKALPEIYNSAMARQWAELARIARARYHRGVHFAGVMTQGGPRCHCGLRPHQAHHALVRALASHGIRHALLPRGGTNIVSAS